ncbi:hypothetical protein [Acidaminococcus intestini]|jgi:hypothetical protein|uniref:hypothetical protein n=1 Tax=Acidaminococcus intestini TaxID=187327 RepID=UPI002054007E|nr:hypothetical protein [Acidaminococcus intestini]DAJ54573.1 MAG TPA: hypothetical protein [Caudoviricetes sp.]
MNEFTDGTMTGNALSMVDMEKRLEALPTTEKVNELIKHAIADLLNSGDVAVNGTQFKFVAYNKISNASTWNNFTYIAKESGWYSAYCEDPKSGTGSAFMRINGTRAKESRVNGNGARDICPGPIWVKAGETILYGCIYFGECKLQVATREE